MATYKSASLKSVIRGGLFHFVILRGRAELSDGHVNLSMYSEEQARSMAETRRNGIEEFYQIKGVHQ